MLQRDRRFLHRPRWRCRAGAYYWHYNLPRCGAGRLSQQHCEKFHFQRVHRFFLLSFLVKVGLSMASLLAVIVLYLWACHIHAPTAPIIELATHKVKGFRWSLKEAVNFARQLEARADGVSSRCQVIGNDRRANA